MLSVQAKDFKEKISAAIAREFEVATELSTGEKRIKLEMEFENEKKAAHSYMSSMSCRVPLQKKE